MKKGVLILTVIAVVLLIVIVFIVLSGKDMKIEENSECIELGCFEDTIYVGSVNSDKYYPCDCRFAKQVNRENIICFASEGEAEARDYLRSDC